MRGWLSDSEWFNMEFLTEEGKEEAKRIRDRLIKKVQGMEELPPHTMEYGISGGLDSNSPEAQGLLSGEEEMLVPKRREVFTPINAINSSGALKKAILL